MKIFRAFLVVVLLCALAGCKQDLAEVGERSREVNVLLSIISDAGMVDWAAFGKRLQANGRIRVVDETVLPPEFNAYSFVRERVIWINGVMFQRYDKIEQAEILLHELVHIKTGELTHEEVKKVCREFRDRVIRLNVMP